MRFAGLHVPTEWIAAHGLKPERILPSADEGCHCAAGACQVAAQLPAGPLIATTQCDQLRRAQHDGFLLDVPAAWQSPSALRLWREELERLSRWLVRQGGSAPDRERLIATADRHDRVRSGLRADPRPERIATWLCDGREDEGTCDFTAGTETQRLEEVGQGRLSNRMAEGHECLPPANLCTSVPPVNRIPIALLGGPLPRDCGGWFAACAEAGLRIALDGSEAGERGLAPPLDRRLLHEDPLQAIAEAHLAMPDPGRRPDTALHDWIATAVTDRGLRGIIVRCDPFCDQWQLQADRLRHWAPVLLVESGENPARRATRLEAFAEMLAC
jgi:hypothetical protein